MIRIGIIVGSTRPGRNGEQVARWVYDMAARRGDAEFELVDLRDHPLPHLDEPLPAKFGQYQHAHTRAWAATIASFDGFVIITPEYNQSVPGVLKNALDYLYAEWNNKAAGLVTYGGAGGVRAAEQLRLILAEMQVATVRAQVALSLFTDFQDFTTLTPGPRQVQSLSTMLDQLVAWGGAMHAMRMSALKTPQPAHA